MTTADPIPTRSWPHAPYHDLRLAGLYFVTSGTYLKLHHFKEPERLTFLENTLLTRLSNAGWKLHAWCILSNHYHFIAETETPQSLEPVVRAVHSITAIEANRLDGAVGRKVWYEYRERHLTFHASYLARMKYVNENAVHHGVVRNALDYEWCSANAFKKFSHPAFYATVMAMKTDRLSEPDDF